MDNSSICVSANPISSIEIRNSANRLNPNIKNQPTTRRPSPFTSQSRNFSAFGPFHFSPRTSPSSQSSTSCPLHPVTPLPKSNVSTKSNRKPTCTSSPSSSNSFLRSASWRRLFCCCSYLRRRSVCWAPRSDCRLRGLRRMSWVVTRRGV